jgi:hypothetical protein
LFISPKPIKTPLENITALAGTVSLKKVPFQQQRVPM